ncbi:hypothetical protein HpEKA22_15050 [Helicobacter pylori]|nr:hypothetical protein VN1192_02270 [Helicobacter pylori]GHR66892.1 hypothetical protein VN1269_14640 [Helicobacter pylori]
MHISEVKTAFKIADVEYVKDSTKLNFNYLKDLKDENNQSLSQNILTQNVARVYLIVVNGEIKKIGGSQADGGIKSTLNIYKDGGVKGRPSIRSFGVWYFLYHTILTGAKIEFYMIYQPNFETQVKGLFGFCAIKDASISYKLLEQACLMDYRNNSKMMHYPNGMCKSRAKIGQMILKMSMPISLKKLKTEKRLSIEKRLTNLNNTK